jgi:hypothetical protein
MRAILLGRASHPHLPVAAAARLDPARLRLPEDGPWATVREFLLARIPRVDPARVDAMFDEGRFVDLDGPIGVDAPYAPGTFGRGPRPVPFDVTVVHQDQDIVVADKPHFLSTIPRGQRVTETALVRLRRQLDFPALVAVNGDADAEGAVGRYRKIECSDRTKTVTWAPSAAAVRAAADPT